MHKKLRKIVRIRRIEYGQRSGTKLLTVQGHLSVVLLIINQIITEIKTHSVTNPTIQFDLNKYN